MCIKQKGAPFLVFSGVYKTVPREFKRNGQSILPIQRYKLVPKFVNIKIQSIYFVMQYYVVKYYVVTILLQYT